MMDRLWAREQDAKGPWVFRGSPRLVTRYLWPRNSRRPAIEQIANKTFRVNWLPPRDSNPDMLLQRQLSYH